MRRALLFIWSASFAIAVSSGVGPAHAAGEGRIVELSDPGEIAQAAAVNKAINAVSDSVMACIKSSSRTAIQCECRATQGLATLRSAYDAAVADHPEWPQPNTTVWWSGTALNFSALKRELTLCP